MATARGRECVLAGIWLIHPQPSTEASDARVSPAGPVPLHRPLGARRRWLSHNRHVKRAVAGHCVVRLARRPTARAPPRLLSPVCLCLSASPSASPPAALRPRAVWGRGTCIFVLVPTWSWLHAEATDVVGPRGGSRVMGCAGQGHGAPLAALLCGKLRNSPLKSTDCKNWDLYALE